MEQPTEAQIKEFWEWCGWEIVEDTGRGWYSIDPITKTRYMGTSDPICLNLLYIPIDLNNLFKYAVPKLRYANIQYSDQYPDVVPAYSATASIQFGDNHTWADSDPAIALFWAIWEAVRGV